MLIMPYYCPYYIYCAGFVVRRQFDPNALYQQQSQTAQNYMKNGGGSQSPPGSSSSSGTAANFDPSSVNTALQTGAGGTGKFRKRI
jgi:hypothetical protein